MPPTAVPTLTVLLDEFGQFWPDAEKPKDESGYRAAVFQNGQAALCLSGGGIRSAAFALGVLQSLSAKRLLTQFHYLSTVSGGGYIGSWLQRWIAEAGSADTVMAALGGDNEPPQIKALRENSNYLTPRVGIGSNDTWTALALSIRNILINSMLFAPLFLLLGLLPNLVAAAIGSQPSPHVAWLMLGLGGACLCWATLATLSLLPSYRHDDEETPDAGADEASARRDKEAKLRGAGDAHLNWHIVLPLVAWGVLATIAVSPLMLQPQWFMAWVSQPGAVAVPASFLDRTPFLHDVAIANLVAMVAALAIAGARIKGDRRAALRHDAAAWLLAAAAASAGLFFSGLWTATVAMKLGFSPLAQGHVLTTLGPVLATGAQFVATIIFVVFRPSGTDRAKVSPDADREWLARLSALKLKPALLWLVVGICAFGIVGTLRAWAASKLAGADLSLAGIVSLVSGAVAVFGGRSSKSGGPSVGAAGKVLKIVPVRLIVAAATLLFALALFTLHAGVEGFVAEKLTNLVVILVGWTGRPIRIEVLVHLGIAAILAAALALLSQQISVNRFSLTGLYRNRLARAFLGGARRQRKPDPFTGFDPADNCRVHELVRKQDGPPQRLYPVINVALNVTSSARLAWQERKAEPFVFTPLYSGSGLLTREEAEPGDPPGAFIASNCYGGNEPDLALGGTGVSLATAMAISGAAASPNMGYNSSPATAFLMSLFNVRLGAWLPNPARAKSLKMAVTGSGPSDNLRAMLRELVGSTQDSGRDIYLSDGGHFDNLGIYEMIRRRCRYIVVSDAGCDPDSRFEDLGNAVRKVAIDQNVKIDFNPLQVAKAGAKAQFAYALGTIQYPEQPQLGHVLYLKPSLFGSIPIDVGAYAAGSPTFPHESTGDQFFSESQFESYRSLGRYFTDELGDGATDIAALFAALQPPAVASKEFREGEPPIADHVGGAIEKGEPGGERG